VVYRALFGVLSNQGLFRIRKHFLGPFQHAGGIFDDVAGDFSFFYRFVPVLLQNVQVIVPLRDRPSLGIDVP
jgi:hypothetical protein